MACQDMKCAEEHRQLAEWLKDYKRLKEAEPCGDCISRKAATDRFDLVQSDDKCMSYDDIMAFLFSLPPVEPERKKGKWEIAEHNSMGVIKCNSCKHYEVRYSKFCPNCGAKMEG